MREDYSKPLIESLEEANRDLWSACGIAPKERAVCAVAAPGLHRKTGLLVHIDESYGVSASALRVATMLDLVGECSDLALYDGKEPVALVEVKIVDHPAKLIEFTNDRAKLMRQRERTGLDAYVIALIATWETGEEIDAVLALVHQKLGVELPMGEVQTTTTPEPWHWRVIAERIPEPAQ